MEMYTQEECVWVLFGYTGMSSIPVYSSICPVTVQNSPKYGGFPCHIFSPGDMPFALYIPKKEIFDHLALAIPTPFYIVIQRSSQYPWCYATAEIFRPKKNFGPKAGDVVFEP